jgi:hypothetical protein
LPLDVPKKVESPPSHEEKAVLLIYSSHKNPGPASKLAQAEALLAINDTLKGILQELKWKNV